MKFLTSQDPRHVSLLGALAAITAFSLWGLSVIFFTWQAHMPAYEILAHRVLWSVVFVGAYLFALRRGAEIKAVLRQPKLAGLLLISGVLVGANWLIFVWAVGQGHIIETSYGYFINPIVVVCLGYVFLKERLSRLQIFAVLLALVAVLIQGTLLDAFPWVALSLTATFGVYGLIKKQVAVGANLGLFVEALWLLPCALVYLLNLHGQGGGHFGGSLGDSVLLMMNGPVTAVPLILFAYAARRLRYATVGLCQYLTPSISFLIAVFVYAEPLLPVKLVSFVIIWLSLVVFTWDLLRQSQSRQSSEPV